MDDEHILVSPPDWWPQTLEEGQVLMALKSVYGTKQAQHCWHERVSKWMYANGYVNINAEKIIFQKSEPNGEFIIHGLFVDDMLHLPSDPRLMREFLAKYNQEFKTTGGMDKLTDAFVGLDSGTYPGRGRYQGAPRCLHLTASRGLQARYW